MMMKGHGNGNDGDLSMMGDGDPVVDRLWYGRVTVTMMDGMVPTTMMCEGDEW